jgi:antitoxin PrlF
MPHYEAKMSSKGQITVPSEVREFMSLKEGDRVDFYVDPRTHSVQILARNGKLSDLIGLLDRGRVPSPPATQEELDSAIGEHLAEKHERISRQWNEWREFQEWRKARAAE